MECMFKTSICCCFQDSMHLIMLKRDSGDYSFTVRVCMVYSLMNCSMLNTPYLPTVTSHTELMAKILMFFQSSGSYCAKKKSRFYNGIQMLYFLPHFFLKWMTQKHVALLMKKKASLSVSFAKKLECTEFRNLYFY